MGDEGIGVHLIQQLEAEGHLQGAKLLDGGTGGFHLLEYFMVHDVVLLIDATLDGQAPGTWRVMQPRFSSDYPATLTAHDIGLKDLLDALYLLKHQPEIYLFAVSIANLSQLSLELSSSLQEKIPELVAAIRDLYQQILTNQLD